MSELKTTAQCRHSLSNTNKPAKTGSVVGAGLGDSRPPPLWFVLCPRIHDTDWLPPHGLRYAWITAHQGCVFTGDRRFNLHSHTKMRLIPSLRHLSYPRTRHPYKVFNLFSLPLFQMLHLESILRKFRRRIKHVFRQMALKSPVLLSSHLLIFNRIVGLSQKQYKLPSCPQETTSRWWSSFKDLLIFHWDISCGEERY